MWTSAEAIYELTGENAIPGKALSIRPEQIETSSEGGVDARVVARQFLGMTTELTLMAAGVTLTARIGGDQEISDETKVRILAYRWVEDDL